MSMTYGVVDTETTGMNHAEDRLVEIAVVREDGSFAHSLVNPGDRLISFGAMATHHITEGMVASAPYLMEALSDVGLSPNAIACPECMGNGGRDDTRCINCDGSGLLGLDGPVDVLVFHHADFDRGFLPEWLREIPYICTWRCALHLFPGAESHKNGSLWYELGLNRPMPPEAGSAPHRALFDALMTRDILEHMILRVSSDHTDHIVQSLDESIDHLIELTSTPVLLTKCNFGKNKGELWADVSSRDMEWVLGKDFDEDTKFTCRHWLKERGRL